jgi:Flp pilus assembly pilin Flp
MSRHRRHGRRERGAALVEFAFVVPVMALLVFGVIELGLAWQTRLTVQTASRAGVRVGSAEANVTTADKGVLLGLGAVLYDTGLANVDRVLIYKSVTTDGAPPAACLTPTVHSVSGSCNAYTGAQLQQVVAGTAPATWFGCGVGSLDLSWCPSSRQSVQALGNDYLGVRVTVRHPLLTGFFGSVLTIEDHAVMRVEPQES